MVWISLQDDVKRSFAKVKEEILNLKRAVNRELLAVEEMGGQLQTFVVKDEFYSFIKRLGERLDKIDENLESYLGYEEEIKNVEAKVKGLGRKLSRQEDLGGEVKEVRALRGKLAALEGSAISANKFNDALSKVSSDVSSLKVSMLTSKVLDGLKAKLANAEKRVEELEKVVPSKEDVLSGLAVIEELKKSAEKLEGDNRKKAEDAEKENIKRLDEVSGRLTADIESVRASSVDKTAFEKSLKELKKDAASIRSVLESSVSEVDFSDYVTKKELVKKLLALEEINSDIGRVAQDNAELENNLESLKRETASLEDVRRIGTDVKEISKSLDSLKAVIEKVVDSGQKRLTNELEQMKGKFEKDISKLKDEFKGKLEKLEKEKSSMRGGHGILARFGKGFADFFREDEEQEVKAKAKPVPSVSEILKEEEKKKLRAGPGFGRFMMPVIITIVIVVLFFMVFWMANKAPDSVDVVDESNASGFVEELPPAEDFILVNESLHEVENVSAVQGTIEYCRQEYECKAREDGGYWFSCYLDEEGTCRCFVTDAEGCGVVEEKLELEYEDESGVKERFSYLITAVIVFAIFLAVYLLVLRNKKTEAKKPKKEKEKAKGEVKEEDSNGVDLEEFFQKK